MLRPLIRWMGDDDDDPNTHFDGLVTVAIWMGWRALNLGRSFKILYEEKRMGERGKDVWLDDMKEPLEL